MYELYASDNREAPATIERFAAKGKWGIWVGRARIEGPPRHRERSEAIQFLLRVAGWIAASAALLTTTEQMTEQRRERYFPRWSSRRRPGPITSSVKYDRLRHPLTLKTTLAVMDPGLRRDDGEYSRGIICPKFCISLALFENRGRREDRMRAAPAVPWACCKNICCPRAYRFSGEPPAFPAQWLYGLYEIVLVTLLFVTPSLSGCVSGLRT
jgi:hypothetical protein